MFLSLEAYLHNLGNGRLGGDCGLSYWVKEWYKNCSEYMCGCNLFATFLFEDTFLVFDTRILQFHDMAWMAMGSLLDHPILLWVWLFNFFINIPFYSFNFLSNNCIKEKEELIEKWILSCNNNKKKMARGWGGMWGASKFNSM